MSSILEQINNLTEQFSSLFEVEGLGQPASDVPPSTNKIKKDRKTKDGKVEIVSVEDELFPYDGNKREQFRQKIIDKINDMIQGTATLEDLLQLVRSKQVKPVKEGFEGAIELLEDIMTTIDKSNKSPRRKEELKRKAEDNQEKELHTLHNYKKLEGSKVPLDIELKRKETKNTRGEHETDERRAKQARSKFKKLGMFDKGYEQARDRFQRALDVEREHSVKEGFEGAIEILEEIINEVSLKKWKESAKNSYDKRKEVADKSAEADKENWDNYDKASRKHPEEEPALYRLAQANSDNAYKDKQRAEHAQKVAIVAPDSKHSANKYLKAAKNAADYHLEKSDYRKSFWQDPHAQKEVRARHKAEMDPVKSRANESFEQAISILKKLINEEKISTNDYHEKKAKIRKAVKDKHPDILKLYPSGVDPIAQEERAKLEGSWEKAQDKQHQQDEKRGIGKGRLWNPTRNDKGDYKTRERSQIENGGFRYKSHDDTVKASIARHNKKVASLKESIQQLSELFDRPSLEDDILKTTTGKGTKQHLQDLGKKLLGLDKKKVKKEKACESFDSLEENSYNIVKLLEEVINEISDKKCREPLEKLKNTIGALEEIKKNVEADEDKKKVDNIVIPDKHKLNVSKEKYEDRIVKRAEDEYKKSKKKKRK